MRSKTTLKFRKLLSALPEEIRSRADEAYAQFCANPDHPGLRFKSIHCAEQIYSARINQDYRVVGLLDGDLMIWFWVGKHAEYEKLLKSL